MEIDNESLKHIAILCRSQIEAETKVKNLEEELKLSKANLKQISEVDIPEALAECGLSELKLTDGQKISVQTYYSASIPKDKINDALDWLRDNGHGDLIKNTVSIDYGKGEDNVAADMKQKLREAGQSFTDKTGVHPQTLKAFAREQTESGKNLPLDLLGVYIGQKTVIKEV